MCSELGWFNVSTPFLCACVRAWIAVCVCIVCIVCVVCGCMLRVCVCVLIVLLREWGVYVCCFEGVTAQRAALALAAVCVFEPFIFLGVFFYVLIMVCYEWFHEHKCL